MPNIRGIAIPDNVGGPFVFGCVGVTGAHVSSLKRFEVLECAKFVGHDYYLSLDG